MLIPLIIILPRIIGPDFALNFIPSDIAALFAHPEKVFGVFLAEPIADLGAVICTATLFKLNFKKILAHGAK